MTRFMDLSGKRVLLMGATSDIGRAIGEGALELGAEVLGTARRPIDDYPFSVVSTDVTDPAAVAAFVASLDGKFDGLVYCIGASLKAPPSLNINDYVRRSMDINVMPFLSMLSELLRARKMAKGGAIVVVSSISAYVGVRGMAPYSMSKAALSACVRNLSNDLERHNIRANAVAPAMIRTRMFTEEEQPWLEDMERRHYPAGLGQPIDVAAPVLFLLSDESVAIKGESLVLSGGAMSV